MDAREDLGHAPLFPQHIHQKEREKKKIKKEDETTPMSPRAHVVNKTTQPPKRDRRSKLGTDVRGVDDDAGRGGPVSWLVKQWRRHPVLSATC
jgi:hypothetical protein